MALITFCIIHYKRLPCLRRCINSIEKYTYVDHEIKLLRQGYLGKETESYLRSIEKRENVEVIRIGRNVGQGGGKSLIVPRATTPFIMTPDDDIYVTEGWLEPILEIFRNEKDVGVVGIPRYFLDGRLEGIGGMYLKIKNGVVEKVKINMSSHYKRDFLEVDGVNAGAMVFRQEVRKDFHFDPRYFIGFDDLDKDLQLLNSRWRKVISLKSKVFHDRSWKSGYYNLRYNWIEIHRSYAQFRKKWGLRLPFGEHLSYSLKIIKYPFDIVYRRSVTFLPWVENVVKTIKGVVKA